MLPIGSSNMDNQTRVRKALVAPPLDHDVVVLLVVAPQTLSAGNRINGRLGVVVYVLRAMVTSYR